MAGRRTQDPRTVMEQMLRNMDRTYEEIAADFETLARNLGERGVTISARHLRRLASGERVGTTPATRRVLQALFGASVDDLLSPYGPERSGAQRAEIRQTDAEVLTMAARRSREFTLSSQVVSGTEAVDRLSDEVREIASIFQREPIPAVLGRLVGAQDAVLTALELRQTPANARQLYFLAAIVSGLLAYVGNDMGKPQIALEHSRSGLVWAQFTDHNGLRAWIKAIQSHICYWAGRSWEAVRYAQAGAELTSGQAGSTVVPFLIASQGRARAALGDSEQARVLLERAADAFERVVPDELDGFGGLCTFGQPRRLAMAARSLAGFPDLTDTAQNYADQAVEAYEDRNGEFWDYAGQADSITSLALARLASREVEGAAESLRPVLELAPEQRVHDIVATVNLVHAGLNRFAPERKARDLQEEIEAFTRISLPGFPT